MRDGATVLRNVTLFEGAGSPRRNHVYVGRAAPAASATGHRFLRVFIAFPAAAAVAAVGIVLFFLGKMRYYAAVSFVGRLIAVGSFVLGVFDYLVDAFVGIDVTSLSAEFIGCAVLFVLTLAVSFLANMMRTE